MRIGIGMWLGRAGGVGWPRLPGTVLDLDARKGVSLDGSSRVQTWTDALGIAVSQSTGALRPNMTTVEGRPALDFTGGLWLENASNSLVTANSAYTVFTVGQGCFGVITIRRTNPVSASLFYPSGGTQIHADAVNASANITIADANLEIGSPFQAVHRYYGGANNPDFFLNGTQRAITSVGTFQGTESGSAGFFIGRNFSVYFGGAIERIIVVSRAVTANELTKWNAYTARRY